MYPASAKPALGRSSIAGCLQAYLLRHGLPSESATSCCTSLASLGHSKRC